jgi:hypothetical protein
MADSSASIEERIAQAEQHLRRTQGTLKTLRSAVRSPHAEEAVVIATQRLAVELEAALDILIAAHHRLAELHSRRLPTHAAEAVLQETQLQARALTDELERLLAQQNK